jgi:hypothetical protein
VKENRMEPNAHDTTLPLGDEPDDYPDYDDDPGPEQEATLA